MACLDFFAVRQDHRQIIDFLFAETDFRVFELYSEFGQELREFATFRELDSAFSIGRDQHGHGFAALLSLWSPSVMGSPHITRVSLDPQLCNGHTFRFTAGGWGAVQLYIGGRHRRVITKSHFGHFSERGARARGYRRGADWKALMKLSNRVSYHIAKRLSVAKAPGRPVLPAAYKLYLAGFELKESAEQSAAYQAVPSGVV